MILKNSFEAQLFDEGYAINCSFANSPDYFPNHWHNFVEVIAPLQDNYELTINGVMHVMKEQEIAYIHPGELHAIHSTRNMPCVILQFDPSLLSRLKSYNDHILLYSQTSILSEAICTEGGAYSLLNTILHLKDLFFSPHEHFRELELYSRLLLFHANLGRILEQEALMQNTNYGKQSLRKYTKQFNLVCNYITDNCEKDLTLEYVAEYSGFSKYHFSRLFKEFTNTTFLNYVTNARLKKTMFLLANTDLAITDIAFQAGFTSLTTFNRIFRQYQGCTPTQYRKLLITAGDS